MLKHKKVISAIVIVFLLSLIFIFKDSNVVFTFDEDRVGIPEVYEMNVHFIDIGQGDSTLIESKGKYMLIDTGERDKKDILISYLYKEGVRKIDYLIGTHPHGDHIGSMDIIVQEFDIGKIIMPDKEHNTKTFERLLDAIDDKKLKIARPVVGDTYKLGTAVFTVVAPNRDYGDNLNNFSVVVKLTNKNNSFLLTGDIETESEHDICNNNIDINADVLKLAHHGSRTSTSKEFLNSVNPKIAVAMCERGNDYGHPHQETLNKLENVNIIRTDNAGTIVFHSDGEELSYTMEKSVSTLKDNKLIKRKYILNKNSKKFHFNSCLSVKDMSPKNKKIYYGLRSNIVKNGYEACSNCRP